MAESKLRKWWRRQSFDDDVAVPKVAARGAPGATTENYEPARAYVDGAGVVFPGVDYGIALSGGGIRSASFCTGVLQALADGSHALERADYLATVSGGGYVGVSTQMLHHVAQPLPAAEKAYHEDAPEFAWLEQKHRYLGRGWQLLVGAAGFVARTALNIGVIAAIVFLAGFWIGFVAEQMPVSVLVPAIVVAASGVALRQFTLPNSPVWPRDVVVDPVAPGGCARPIVGGRSHRGHGLSCGDRNSYNGSERYPRHRRRPRRGRVGPAILPNAVGAVPRRLPARGGMGARRVAACARRCPLGCTPPSRSRSLRPHSSLRF